MACLAYYWSRAKWRAAGEPRRFSREERRGAFEPVICKVLAMVPSAVACSLAVARVRADYLCGHTHTRSRAGRLGLLTQVDRS